MSAALASDSEFGRERWRREEGGGRENRVSSITDVNQ